VRHFGGPLALHTIISSLRHCGLLFREDRNLLRRVEPF
jgi:hypothetical protein